MKRGALILGMALLLSAFAFVNTKAPDSPWGPYSPLVLRVLPVGA